MGVREMGAENSAATAAEKRDGRDDPKILCERPSSIKTSTLENVTDTPSLAVLSSTGLRAYKHGTKENS